MTGPLVVPDSADMLLRCGSSGGGGTAPITEGLVFSTCLGDDGSQATQSFVVPPALEDGDVVAHFSFKSNDVSPTFPLAGWTELGSQIGSSNSPRRGLSINYKVITDAATELAGVTWDFVSATADQNVGHLWVVRGVDNADPIDVHSFSNTFNTIDPFKTRAVTTTVDNAFIMSASYGGMQTGGAGTPEVVSAPPHVLTFDKYTPAAGGGFGQIVAGASFWVAGLAGLTTQDNYAMGGVHTRTWTSGETTLAFNPA